MTNNTQFTNEYTINPNTMVSQKTRALLMANQIRQASKLGGTINGTVITDVQVNEVDNHYPTITITGYRPDDVCLTYKTNH